METARRIPENVTFADAAYQILDTGSTPKDLKFSEEDFIKLHNLIDKWKEETLLISSIDEIESNESYLQIIVMGEKALPFMFQDVKYEPALWVKMRKRT